MRIEAEDEGNDVNTDSALEEEDIVAAETTGALGDHAGSSRKGSGRRLRGAVAHYLGTAIVSGRIAPGNC